MKRLVFVLLLFFIPFEILSQVDLSDKEENGKTYFSEQIYRYYAKFKEKSNRAFVLGNREEANFYYQQLVNKHLVGSFMDNFNADCFSSDQCQIQDFKKPLILFTYASWSVPTKGEIPAINSMAKKYKDDVDFAVIFWDSKSDVRQASKAYNKHIQILYVDELKTRDAYTVKMLKHSLGFPTIFVVGSNKKIIEIKRNFQNEIGIEDEVAVENCLNEFKNLVESIQNFEENLVTNSFD